MRCDVPFWVGFLFFQLSIWKNKILASLFSKKIFSSYAFAKVVEVNRFTPASPFVLTFYLLSFIAFSSQVST
jgi:hypothetical protein